MEIALIYSAVCYLFLYMPSHLLLADALVKDFLEASANNKALVYQLIREDFIYLLLFSFGLMYLCINRAILSRKCSIQAPAK